MTTAEITNLWIKVCVKIFGEDIEDLLPPFESVSLSVWQKHITSLIISVNCQQRSDEKWDKFRMFILDYTKDWPKSVFKWSDDKKISIDKEILSNQSNYYVFLPIHFAIENLCGPFCFCCIKDLPDVWNLVAIPQKVDDKISEKIEANMYLHKR